MAEEEYVPAVEAAEFMGVKRETLYAYVSRGLVESVPDPESSRARLYRRADLERLKARATARSGEGPAAAGALRWGAPVLETSICEVRDDGPAYRGRPLAAIVAEGSSFEQVAEFLWTGELHDDVRWEPIAVDRRRAFDSDEPVAILRQAVLRQELADPTRFATGPAAFGRQSRRLTSSMVSSLAAAFGRSGTDPAAGDGFAASVAVALGARPTSRTVRAVDTALVVCAEHELNASAFAARVAASTGANLYACVTAALAAFTGPRHGGVDARIRRLLDEAGAEGARDALTSRLRAGESIPGFGQPLYHGGDPRFDMLWACVDGDDRETLSSLRRLVDAAESIGLEPPNLDLGLAAVAKACGLGPGSASALFALGRTAGWIAHAREQAEQGFLLRPRARYAP